MTPLPPDRSDVEAFTDMTAPGAPPSPAERRTEAIIQLRRGVLWLVALTVALGAIFIVDSCQDDDTNDRQDSTDEHLAETDAELERTADRLAELVEAEARDDEVEEASACVRSHVVYAGLSDILTQIGEASDSISADETAAMIAVYPEPTCDMAAAQAVLAG